MSFEFRFPDYGEGLTEGRILEFRVSPGDHVAAGDVLAIVETDKVVAEVESPKAGTLVKFGSKAGNQISVGETIAFIDVEGDIERAVDEGSDAKPADQLNGAAGTNREVPKLRALIGTIDASTSVLAPSDELAARAEGQRARERGQPDAAQEPAVNRAPRGATPAARRLARELQVDLPQLEIASQQVPVRRADVAAAGGNKSPAQRSSEPAPSVAPTAGPSGIPLIDDPLARAGGTLGATVELTILRKTIAHTMETSNKIPTATIYDTGVVDDLVELRQKVNRDREVRVSFQPFFMKALATALRRFPVLNAHFNPLSEEITMFEDVNIGVAVHTEAGLMVPVIHHVETKTIREIDEEMKTLVERSKDRTIALQLLRGGTFSLTNFGSFGGLYASPMIYPPQVAIIGAGRLHQAPTVLNGTIAPAWVLPVSLGFDHRVVDGVPAASFTAHFLELLRSPQELFVSM
jgi:pyruvate dehydrogenase E2 component (dihydrolipoamide acetyltransferase)